MRHVFHACATAVAIGSALVACGSLDSQTDSAPALATLQGSLVNPTSVDVSSGAAVRVAVVWRGLTFGQFNVVEDLPVQPVFPSAFTIAFDGPPPAAAMNSEAPEQAPATSGPSSGSSPVPAGDEAGAGPGPTPDASGGLATGDGGSADVPDALTVQSQGVSPLDTPVNQTAPAYAVGTVVAYLDQNHNGKLDLVADGASAYVDQILATNQEISIAYFEGAIPEVFLHQEGVVGGPKDGYNLVRVPLCNVHPVHPLNPNPNPNPACPATADAGADAGPCPPEAWLDMTTPYPLTVATSPAVASLMCLDSNGPGVSSTGTGPAGPFDPALQPAQYPLPCDPNLMCASDGSDYLFATCTEISQGLCKGTLLSCTSVGYARPTPTPADWPCPN